MLSKQDRQANAGRGWVKRRARTAVVDLISIEEAAARGITRLRRPVWASPFDHIKIDIIDGRPGPWSHLYAPFNRECNGRDPVDILNVRGADLCIDPDEPWFVPYGGPLPHSDEYRLEVAKYSGALRKATA